MAVLPRRSSHPTYLATLVFAGVTHALDAEGIDKSVSKRQFINDGLIENAKCRIRGAPNDAQYSLVYALNDYPIHEEMKTCYEREYWLRKHQRAKLSESDQFKAADLYKILAPRNVNQLSSLCCCFIV